MFQQPRKMSARMLLSRPHLAIPIYQRGYAWTSDEVSDFCEDLDELWSGSATPEHEHFLGMMLSYNRTEEHVTVLEVIDGQQRLTTTSLLVLAFLDQLRPLRDALEAAGGGGEKARELEATLEDLIFAKLKGNKATKLTLNERDQGEWERLLTTGASLPKVELANASASATKLNAAYDLLRGHLAAREYRHGSAGEASQSFDKLATDIKKALDGLSVVLLTADDSGAVYNLFMVINDRGKPLSVMDLLRTGTLSRLKDDRPRFNRANLAFAPLMESFEEDVQRALAFYINSHLGSRVAKTALLKRVGNWLYGAAGDGTANALVRRTEALSKGVEYLLAIAQKNADWYGDAYPFESDPVGAERQHRLLSALKHDSAKPLLVAGVECLDAPQFRGLLGVLERIALRAFLTNGVHKSTLADFHIEQARLMRENPETWTAQQLWSDALAEDLGVGRRTIALKSSCPDSKLIEGVRALDWKNQRGLIAYLLLGIDGYDFENRKPHEEKIFHWSKIHLDHIVPRSDESSPVYLAGLIDTIGNLTPLDGKKNRDLGAMPYGPHKAAIYKKSQVMMTRQLGVDFDNWGPANASERTETLANLACEVWSLSEKLW
jgi:hypothetical protein